MYEYGTKVLTNNILVNDSVRSQWIKASPVQHIYFFAEDLLCKLKLFHNVLVFFEDYNTYSLFFSSFSTLSDFHSGQIYYLVFFL